MLRLTQRAIGIGARYCVAASGAVAPRCACAQPAQRAFSAAAATSAAATPAAAVASPSPSPSSSSLYRSPLRSIDDRVHAHLWQGALVLEASGPHENTVVWLHGLGQSVHSLETIMSIMQGKNTKFLVPQAPKLGITCLPHDPDQHAWFDIIEEKMDAVREKNGEALEEDEAGLDEMRLRIHELLLHEMETTGVPSHRILLAGFAQGGAMALHAGLSFPHPLAGVMSIAGYLPTPHLYPSAISPANSSTRVLAVHGNSDFVVPLAFAKQRYETLKQAKLPFEWRTEWSMGNFISNATLMACQNWMRFIFAKADEVDAAAKKK